MFLKINFQLILKICGLNSDLNGSFLLSSMFDLAIYIYIYIYIYVHINLSRINRTTMNLLLKVSRFFHGLRVNVLLTKIFLDFLF